MLSVFRKSKFIFHSVKHDWMVLFVIFFFVDILNLFHAEKKLESMLNSSLYPYICIHTDMWMAEYGKENEGVWMDGAIVIVINWQQIDVHYFYVVYLRLTIAIKTFHYVSFCFASLLSASHSDGRTFVKSFISLWSILRFVVRGLPFSSALYRNENGIHSWSYAL